MIKKPLAFILTIATMGYLITFHPSTYLWLVSKCDVLISTLVGLAPDSHPWIVILLAVIRSLINGAILLFVLIYMSCIIAISAFLRLMRRIFLGDATSAQHTDRIATQSHSHR
jgi:hypothetical protein